MTTRTIEPLKFGEDTIYIEVSEVDQQGEVIEAREDGFEKTTALSDIVETGEKVRSTVAALAGTIQQALSKTEPSEWTLEINLGFKGTAGIPFITEGEANGAVKVVAKWTRSVPVEPVSVHGR